MKNIKIAGLSLPLFAAVTVIVLFGTLVGALPTGMVGALAVLMVLGALLGIIGDNTPIVKSFLGGGAIVIIFGSAALVYFELLPESVTQMVKTFMESGAIKGAEDAVVGYKAGFLDFYIAALITGSILGMDRDLLINAAIRFIPTIIGGVVVALGAVALVGGLVGYGAKDAVVFIGIPIMGGGMGAGAVPIAEIFSGPMGVATKDILSKLVPAVALGNAVAIVFGGLLNKLGKMKPEISGEGKLLRTQSTDGLNEKEEEQDNSVKVFGIGIILSTTFMILGTIISKYVPGGVHFYAWMIISVAIVKGFGLLPRSYELACQKWYQFVAANFTFALLAGIGIAYTDLGQVIESFSLMYLLLVVVTVVGAVVGTMLVGRLLGFYEIEAAITAGLCMANMGGTGDVAVLSAADRMNLMPFAQISSRIGGTLIILLATALVQIFF